MEAPQLQFFDRGRCARAARWISGHYFLSPFLTVPLQRLRVGLGGFWTNFQHFRRGHDAQQLDTVVKYTSSIAGWLWKNLRYYYVVGRLGPRGRFFLLVVATLVVNNGSGTFSTGLAGLRAPQLRTRRLLAGSGRERRRSRQWHVQAETGWVCW